MKAFFTLLSLVVCPLYVAASSDRTPETERLVRKLNFVVLEDFEIREEPFLEALKAIQTVYSELNPAKERLSVAIDTSIVNDTEFLQRPITVSFRNVPIYEVLRCLGTLADLRFHIAVDTVIYSPKEAQQDAAANP